MNLNTILAESVADAQRQAIDAFLEEFKDFDVKHEKQRLKHLEKHLNNLQHHTHSELFSNGGNDSVMTRKFYAVQQEMQDLAAKIARYEEEKPMMNCFAISHSDHFFKKHGKIV